MAALHRRRSCNCRSLNCAAVADLSTSGVCRRLSGWRWLRIKAGAPSRGRTGMTFRSTDFRTCYGFRRRAKARLGSGVRHDHESPSELPLGPRRPLSTPAGCSRAVRIGSALPRDFPGDSPTLTGFSRAFPRLPLNFSKSVASTNFAIGASASVYLGTAARGEMPKSGSRAV